MRPQVVAVTPGDHRLVRDVISLVEGAVAGGVSWVVLREPHLETRDYVALARRLAQLLPDGIVLHGKHPAALDLADRAGWHLHLPAGANLKDARSRVGGRLGVSCHSRIEVAAARKAGADYVFYSPIFKPISKERDSRKAVGIEGLTTLARDAGIDVVAQGGITPDRVNPCLEAGAAGVAVTGALFPPGVTPEDCRGLAHALCRAH